MSELPTVALGELMARNSGSVDPSRFPREAFDLYSIPAFDNGRPELSLGREIGSSKQIVQPNDVLLSRIVPHIRRAWVVGERRGYRQIASGEWIVFRSANIHPSYLRYLLVEDRFHEQFMNTVAGVGGSLLRARPSQVADIEVPLPSLSEQQRIARQLEQADRLRRTRRYALELTETFLSSAFLELFGDPIKNPRAFDQIELEEDLERIESGFSPVCEGPREMPSQWAVLGLGAVTSGVFRPEENKKLPSAVPPRPELEVKDGDVLITRKNTYDLVAACAYVRKPPSRLLLPDTIFRFRLKQGSRLSPVFLWGLFSFPAFRKTVQKMASGSAGSMPGISKEKFLSVKCPVPPASSQQSFSDQAERISRLISIQTEAFRQAEHLFQSLLHDAFGTEPHAQSKAQQA